MKTTYQIEASAPANVRPSKSVSKTSNAQPDFVRHCTNRRLSTETVLDYLRTRLPRQYEVAEVVGKWVWLDVSPARKPLLAKVLWTLGFHWNQRRGVWQHPCGSFDPLGSHPAELRSLLEVYGTAGGGGPLSGHATTSLFGRLWLIRWDSRCAKTMNS